jgi:steroid delta-isomerase-like uncharacterized protein
MSAEANKAVVRRFFDELNHGNVSALDDLLDAQYAGHFTGIPVPMNRDGFKQFADLSTGPFPDFFHEIEDLLAEDDKVVARVTYSGTHKREFMGMPATGKQVRFSGINVFSLKGGKIIEHWSQSDQLSMLQQMGAIPSQP